MQPDCLAVLIYATVTILPVFHKNLLTKPVLICIMIMSIHLIIDDYHIIKYQINTTLLCAVSIEYLSSLEITLKGISS